MKLLKIIASGIPLFKDKCEIDFLAQQRVSADNANDMSCLFSSGQQAYYQNNVISFIGINASGKTTILKLITFVCRMINNESINNIAYSEILDSMSEESEAVFDVFFYAENQTVNMLHTVVSRKGGRLFIKDEYLKSKSISKVKRKADIFDFNNNSSTLTRNKDEEFLLDDISIIIAYNKKNKERLALAEMLQYTNINELNLFENCPSELIAFFDPSVEYLIIQKDGKDYDIRLKFRNEEEVILNKASELNRYLSSGTIKGINIFLYAIKTFETGGYLIVDELENHFNHEIVSTLIRFYKDKKVNPKGAMLIFTTHYAELLDEFERNDNIFTVRNDHGIKAENLSLILKRNDIKKSDAYQSGFLQGTTPMYDSYMNLKKELIKNQGGKL